MTDLITQSSARIKGMEQVRYTWHTHWRECADFVLPRRYTWLVTPNNQSRGSPLNSNIFDSTGTIAARNLSAGLMAGITSPTRPWFRLRISGQGVSSSGPVSLWLAEVERRMMQVMQESNFYTGMATLYFDLVVFGTGTMIIDEDYTDIIRCYNPCLGEFYLENSDRMQVDTFARIFVLTIAQIVQWFGLESCSEEVKNLFAAGGSNLSQERRISHLIEPNTVRATGAPPSSYPYREMYFETDGAAEALQITGLSEFKVICPRWDLQGNEPYGRSPAMDALPDIKQLQQETRRKAQAIDKMVNPPMIADVQLRNQPASLLPGAITYATGLSTNPGFKPVYQIMPPIRELQEDIAEVQARIRTTFYNDLFLMISQLQTVRTATEIDARREEKLILLGPALERFEAEGPTPAIKRIFSIMDRARLFPPRPVELSNQGIQIEYVSMLASAQNASSTAGIERVLALVGNIAAGQVSVGMPPEALDKLNTDATIDDYAEKLNVAPKLINDDKRVAQIRQARNQQLAQQKQQEDAAAAVQGAQVLSKTEVGGGVNALQTMLGNTLQ